MFLGTILQIFRARSEHFFGIFSSTFQGSIQYNRERPMRIGIGYADFRWIVTSQRRAFVNLCSL